MSDDDRPITKAELDHYMSQINAQLNAVVEKAVSKITPAQNPTRQSKDPEAWSLVQSLQAEIRERDRAELEQMRNEIRALRDQPSSDPLEEIENARALVAALGPEGDSQLMQGLGYLSNVAEAYIEKSKASPPPHQETPQGNAAPVSQEPEHAPESHHPPEHISHGPQAAANGGFLVIEDPH